MSHFHQGSIGFMSSRRVQEGDGEAIPQRRPESAMYTFVALLAHHDDVIAKSFEEIFDVVACDWRLTRVEDGAAAARHVLQKGLPELLITAADLPKIAGPDLIEWLRSFRTPYFIPVMVYGDSSDLRLREKLLPCDVNFMMDGSTPRKTLTERLALVVSQVEKRRLSVMT